MSCCDENTARVPGFEVSRRSLFKGAAVVASVISVQEPALTLLKRAKARVLVNGMDLEDAKHYFGGSFEFMGVAVRADEIERRRPEMVALTKALAEAKVVSSASSGPPDRGSRACCGPRLGCSSRSPAW
jgi:hypothetical protein